MLAIALNGGLGNQLFQLAAIETIANETGRKPCVYAHSSPRTVHADTNYFTTVLSNWKSLDLLSSPYQTVDEPSFEKQDWSCLPPGNVCINGYFQNWRYVPEGFTSRLSLPSCEPLQGAFLHIRGGDYVNHWLHDVGLQRNYYRAAMERFPVGTHFYVFTNDRNYAESLDVLRHVPHTYVESDEVTSLAQMALCTEGGICANSTFSWWGAYLNPKRTLILPNKWFNRGDFYSEGYYFPGVQTCPV